MGLGRRVQAGDIMTHTKQELDAVLQWRGKHAAALKQRDELRQQLADVMHDRDLTALAIADAASKLGISSEGVALTGPHLLMLLGDMVGMVEGLQARNAAITAALEGMVEYFPQGHSDGECFSVDKAKWVLAQSAPAADEQRVE
jgi:ferric-dicitrate binding protein FerR (iron transport regulator)